MANEFIDDYFKEFGEANEKLSKFASLLSHGSFGSKFKLFAEMTEAFGVTSGALGVVFGLLGSFLPSEEDEINDKLDAIMEALSNIADREKVYFEQLVSEIDYQSVRQSIFSAEASVFTLFDSI